MLDTMFHPKMKNADLFAMLSQATEVSPVILHHGQ